MAFNNYGIKKVLGYFSEGPYFIPDYQRDYAWEVDAEVKELWDDFENIRNDKSEDFFMGQIVVHNDDEHKYIIDGQQRSITLMLFGTALMHVVDEMCMLNSDVAEDLREITDGLHHDLCIYKGKNNEKLILAKDLDKVFFSEKILHGNANSIFNINVPKNMRKAHKNIINAYKFFYNNIKMQIDELDGIQKKCDLLSCYYRMLNDVVKLMYIETNNECEAFMIFETLNARGRNLETSDLLKNYLFKISGNTNINFVKTEWEKLTEEFNDVSVTSYIRYIWNSENEFIREKSLYKKMVDNIQTSKKAKEFVEKLRKDEALYLTMVDPKNPKFYENERNINAFVDELLDMAILRVKTYYPILLAYYNSNNLDNETMIKNLYLITKGIEKVIVRDIVIAQHNPSSYEVEFARISKMISDEEIKTVDEIVEELSKISISDTEFKNRFMDYTEKDTAQGKDKIRFILRKIENLKPGETEIKRDNDQVHIEHIMPQTIGDWNIDKEKHDEYLWKLGNLTLLLSRDNIDIQNSGFDVKKEKYKESKLNINIELAKNYDTWNIETIDQRQEELYEKAKEIWSF